MKLSIWFAGTMNEFAKQFGENDALYNQARMFWRSLEGSAVFLLIVALLVGAGLGAYYYTVYNNQPGRHYQPKKWLCFLLLTAGAVLALTFGIEYLAAKPKLSGAFALEMQIAFVNAVYAALFNIVTSVVWCNFLPTNAYRLFKK